MEQIIEIIGLITGIAYLYWEYKGDRRLWIAAIIMPATPEVFSIGVQASFVSGEFIIDLGVSISPVPFQKRKHSEFHYK